MKIMQVLPELHGGGVERGTLEIAQYLTENGHESHVVSAGGHLVKELEAKGSSHHQCKVVAKSPRSLVGIFQLRQLITTLRPDIIHVRSRIPGWVVEFAYKTLPKALRPVRISTFHGFHSVNHYSAIMTRGERIIAVSQTIADHIQQAYGVPKEKIEIIYRGIDPSFFDPAHIDVSLRENLRIQWGLPDPQTPALLMPGRFTRLKGHAFLLEALSSLMDIPWFLVFVGDHGENPSYTQELQKMAAQLGIQSRIYFHGPCHDMPGVYAAADLVLNVSTRPESFGRTAVEAMGMAKPVIVSGHGGALETIIDGETGWKFVPNNSTNLTQMLRKALSAQEKWPIMGLNGRAHVVKNFALQVMCEKKINVYAQFSHKEAE